MFATNLATPEILAIATSAVTGGHDHAAVAPPQFERLMFFGFASMLVAVFCYVERNRGNGFVLTLAISLAATAVYGFAQGAWPLGFIQFGLSVTTFRIWVRRMNFKERQVEPEFESRASMPAEQRPDDSRLQRLFGRSSSDN